MLPMPNPAIAAMAPAIIAVAPTMISKIIGPSRSLRRLGIVLLFIAGILMNLPACGV